MQKQTLMILKYQKEAPVSSDSPKSSNPVKSPTSLEHNGPILAGSSFHLISKCYRDVAPHRPIDAATGAATEQRIDSFSLTKQKRCNLYDYEFDLFPDTIAH